RRTPPGSRCSAAPWTPPSPAPPRWPPSAPACGARPSRSPSGCRSASGSSRSGTTPGASACTRSGGRSCSARVISDRVLPDFDVAIVGAGDVGCAIARELARFELRVALIESEPDVGAGTSKANTAILHTGFDAKPGTLEAALVRRGHALLLEHGPRLGIPIEPTGAVLVAWTAEQAAALPGIAARAAENGYTAARPVSLDELRHLEPHLGPGATAALAIPDEHIVCPFTMPLAFATEAVANGVDLRLHMRVGSAAVIDGGHRLQTTAGAIDARWVVNAAGLNSDT